MESFEITYPNITVTDTSFEIRPVMPGTTYNVTVSFVNEVGESLNNPVGTFTCQHNTMEEYGGVGEA